MIGLLSDLLLSYSEHLVVVDEALLDCTLKLHLVVGSLAFNTNSRHSPRTASAPGCLSKGIIRPRVLALSSNLMRGSS